MGPVLRLYVITSAVLFMCCGLFVAVERAALDDPPSWILTVMAAATVLGMVFFVLSGIQAIDLSVARSKPSLHGILASYLSVILCFGALYFILQAVTEHSIVMDEVLQHKQGRKWSTNPVAALTRIDEPIWVDGGTPPEGRARIRLRSKGAVAGLAVDSFHFSVVTITTLGYGDIHPNTWYTKLTADLECLLGMAILVYALGRYLNRRSIPT